MWYYHSIARVKQSIAANTNRIACVFAVRLLREELQLLQEQGSHVGEVIKPMDKKKVLVKVSW